MTMTQTYDDIIIASSRARSQLEQEYYGNVLIIKDASQGTYIHTDIQTKTRSIKTRSRRFSIDVLTIDQYTQSPNKTITLTSKPRQEITISDPTLHRPTPNPSRAKTYYQDSACEISKRHFRAIAQPGVWFNDEILTTGFALLDRVLNCQQHHMSLLSVWAANAIYKYRHEQPTGALPMLDQHEVVSACASKDFLIIPISDGFLKMRQQGLADELANDMRMQGCTEQQIAEILPNSQHTTDSTGSHWSLLIIDCRAKSLKGRYFDSWAGTGFLTNIQVAQLVLEGVFYLLSHEQPGQYSKETTTFAIDANAPKQQVDNACAADRGGACGSFVWAIAKEFAQYIVECREDEQKQARDGPCRPVEIDIKLPGGFKERWKWNSAHTRRAIGNLIERERRVRLHLNGTTAWFDDRKAGRQGWKKALRERGLPGEWFWDPYRMESWFEDGAWRYRLKE